MKTAAAADPTSNPSASHGHGNGATSETLQTTLDRMKAAQRRSGAPSYEDRIRALEKLERALLSRKDAVVAAISRDFGNRSKHESLVSEVFLVVGAIKHARAHLRDWMEPEEREVGWVFLPASVEVRPQPVGVVGIISPWNYPVQLALSPLVQALAAGNRVMLKPSESFRRRRRSFTTSSPTRSRRTR